LTAVLPVAIKRPARPYPGLRPFDKDEWAIFFGRERMIEEVIARLANSRVVLIHGVSGSGKSSLVRAGVLPKLALQYSGHDTPWLTCAIRPSGGPLWNLAKEFAALEGRGEDLELVSAIAGKFNARSVSLSSVAASLNGIGGKSLCLLVDQFEELFRYEKEPSRDEAELFVDLIERAARETEVDSDAVDLHVIVTMRSEFLGECARFTGFAETINRTQYLVPRMDDDGLMRAVRRPAQMYGAMFDESLAERLTTSVRGREDELPLLQHGLMLMWEDAAGRAEGGERATMDGAIVDKAGGLSELLSEHADKVMASVLAPDEGRAPIVTAAFRALTDVNAEGSAIRRPLTFRDLCAVTSALPDELLIILDAFRAPGVSFLTPYAPMPIHDATPIDVSHEALIRCWRRINSKEDGWLQNEIRDGLAWRTLLYQAENFANDKSSYLSAPATETRAKWLTERNEGWAERYGGGWSKVRALIDASRERWKQEAEREQAHRQKEIENERLLAQAAHQSEIIAKQRAEAAEREVAAVSALRAEAEQRTFAERQAREAESEVAALATARAQAEAALRVAAEEKTLLEQRAREDAQASARKLRRSLRYALGAGGFAVVMFFFSVYEAQRLIQQTEVTSLAKEAELRAREAEHQAKLAARQVMDEVLRANQALAESINNDLALQAGRIRGARQREALWKLAAADEQIKSDFVSILAQNPEETIRSSRGFPQVSRALGLLRPTPIEAEALIAAVVGALQTPEGQKDAAFLAAEFETLAAKLTKAQAHQALNPVLTQMGRTSDPFALKALARALQALPANLTETQASQALEPVLELISQTTSPPALRTLAEALQALAAKLTNAQASKASDSVLNQLVRTTDPYVLQALALSLRALGDKLTEAQAHLALAPVLEQMGQTTDPSALGALAQALEALPANLTEEQAFQALDPVLRQIGQTSDSYKLQALAEALQALAPKLTETQASRALDAMLKQIVSKQRVPDIDPDVLRALAQTLQALTVIVTPAQGAQAFDVILNQIGRTTSSFALQALTPALQALAAKWSEEKGDKALDQVLKRISATNDPATLSVLAQALQALAGGLSEEEASRAQHAILERISETTSPSVVKALTPALGTLPAKLNEERGSQVLELVLQQIRQTADPSLLRSQAQALQALAGKLSEDQAHQVLDLVLKQIGETADPFALLPLVEVLQASPVNLTEPEAHGVLESLLRQIEQTTDPSALRALAGSLQALGGKLSREQAQLAINPLLTQIGQTTDPSALQALSQALQSLTATLSEVGAREAFDSVLKQISQTADPAALRALARALQALSAKLTYAQALQASEVASSSLAWAAYDEEAAEWARALVAVSLQLPDRLQMLATAIAFPPAAGLATEVLLDAIRAEHPDAPKRGEGTEATLEWLAKTYPQVLHPPSCPQPLQPGLKCPY
jgi:hypothetical protein